MNDKKNFPDLNFPIILKITTFKEGGVSTVTKKWNKDFQPEKI